MGTTVSIIKIGDDTTIDSTAQSLVVPPRFDTPANLQGSKTSFAGEEDGTISGLTGEVVYEISGDSGETWQEKTADAEGKITGLAAGDYRVRVKAVENTGFASLPASMTIDSGEECPSPQAAPAAPELDSKTYNSVTLKTIAANGNGAAAEYSRDGGETWQGSPTFTGLSASTEYSFVARYAEVGNYAASPASAELKVTTNTAPSSGGGGSGSSSTTTTTEKNPDGSTTTTVTDKTTGTVTETTKNADGSTIVVETKKDGSKITTVTTKDGTKTVTKTGTDGKTTATVSIPSGKDGADVKLPVDLGKEDGTVSAKVTYKDKTETVSVSYSDGEVSLRVSDSAIIEILDDFVPLSPALPFTDVMPGDWCYEAVQYVLQKGLMNGTSADTFNPNAPLSRAMLWTILGRVDGEALEGPGVFAAAKDWAVENGISDGTNASGSITRQQLATMIYRYEQSRGNGFTGEWMFSLDYPDADTISGYASEAMHWCVMKGIINGQSDGTLSPNSGATRAQTAVMLMRLLEGAE